MAKPLTIAAARERIAALSAERIALLNSPRDHASTRNEIGAWCSAQATIGDARLAHRVAGVAFGNDLNEMLSVPISNPVTGIAFGNDHKGPLTVQATATGMIDMAALLAAVLGPNALCAALCRHLDQTESGPTAAERAERLAEIDRELLEIETAEERLIEVSEAAGAPIARRADANPRAVLGMTA